MRLDPRLAACIQRLVRAPHSPSVRSRWPRQECSVEHGPFEITWVLMRQLGVVKVGLGRWRRHRLPVQLLGPPSAPCCVLGAATDS
jgi:hypothetical protein